MATYQEEIANWRAQRRQQEANNRLQELRQEHAQQVRERDTAIANNDLESAASADDQMQYLENEYAQLVGPQQPQMDSRLARWSAMNKDYLDRLIATHGNKKATQYLDKVEQYLTSPKNPYGGGGMGLPRYSQAYFDRGKDFLEMYSERDTGVPYEPNATLTAEGAAKISGLSPQEYNRAAQQIGDQRRYSWQQGNK